MPPAARSSRTTKRSTRSGRSDERARRTVSTSALTCSHAARRGNGSRHSGGSIHCRPRVRHVSLTAGPPACVGRGLSGQTQLSSGSLLPFKKPIASLQGGDPMRKRFRLGRAAVALALSMSGTAIAAEVGTIQNAVAGDWPSYHRTYEAHRYSPAGPGQQEQCPQAERGVGAPAGRDHAGVAVHAAGDRRDHLLLVQLQPHFRPRRPDRRTKSGTTIRRSRTG